MSGVLLNITLDSADVASGPRVSFDGTAGNVEVTLSAGGGVEF